MSYFILGIYYLVNQLRFTRGLSPELDNTIENLPEGFHQGISCSYSEKMLSHLKHMRSQKLFDLFKTIPKGSLHHLHFDCSEDAEFVLSVANLVPKTRDH